MYRCPHCTRESIFFRPKWWSSSGSPTSCPACNGLSYVPTAVATSIIVGATMWLIIFGLISAMLNSALPLIPGGVGAIAIYGYCWDRVALVATDEATATRTQRVHTVLTLLAWLIGLFS